MTDVSWRTRTVIGRNGHARCRPEGLPDISRGLRSAATIPPVRGQTNLPHPGGVPKSGAPPGHAQTLKLRKFFILFDLVQAALQVHSINNNLDEHEGSLCSPILPGSARRF